jgi:predicted esterase
MVRAVALGVSLLVLHCAAAQDASQNQLPRGVPHEVVFTGYSPLFSNAEIPRRLLTPLAREDVRDTLGHTDEALSPYPIDLAREKFLVYVPSSAPPSPRGFALLVFVPPYNHADLPFGWAAQLDRHGFIFVAPANAGNATNVVSRRVPLALSAEENVVREYPVDRERIYIGGFSGGSRVAERVALAYPDVFHGALLNAGADPLGGAYPLPPRDLFLRFQSSTRLVYDTGELDGMNLGTDAGSAQSMHDMCVFDVEMNEIPDTDHEWMSPTAFGRALSRLLDRSPPDPARLEACRSHVQAGLQQKLDQAQSLISAGQRENARKLLLEIDSRYGGLAAPRILELARSCGCGLAGP